MVKIRAEVVEAAAVLNKLYIACIHFSNELFKSSQSAKPEDLSVWPSFFGLFLWYSKQSRAEQHLNQSINSGTLITCRRRLSCCGSPRSVNKNLKISLSIITKYSGIKTPFSSAKKGKVQTTRI